MMGFLTYLRLKIVVVLLRLLARLVSGPTQCFPDRVLHIVSREAGRRIKVHVYESGDDDSKPRPVLLNLHGSGFILPYHGSDDEFCARVARETGYTVFDVQYRLAPENPFPAALEDVEDVANCILQKPEDFDLTRLAISGFSAGGNLALATASGICGRGTFSSVLAFYPSTNKSLDPGDRRAPDTSVKAGSVALSRLFDRCYIKSGMDKKNPLISPSFASAQAFPQNVLVITAAQDNLCLEAEALAAKIKDADESCNVVTMRMEKCGHAWDKSAKSGILQEKAKDEAYTLAIKMLRMG
jgi:acetyl esterase/lipase